MSFPKWCRNPEYLPNLTDIEEIPNEWNWCKSDFVHHNPLWTPFQILNEDFIKWLSYEIIKIIDSIKNKDITILEVWAWNWRLSYFLKKEINIENTKRNVIQIATDDFSWIEKNDPYLYVKSIKWISLENCNVEDSIKNYKPSIVISSWMPHNEDWTEVFRKNNHIDAFILIWNPDECWTDKTWKNCNNFKWEELKIDWNICWQNFSNNWKRSILKTMKSYSKVFLFKRI